jgi:hypothetical protein
MTDIAATGTRFAAAQTGPIENVSLHVGTTPVSASAPTPAKLFVGTTAVSASAPVPSKLYVGTDAVSASAPVPATLYVGTTAVSAVAPAPATLYVGTTAVAASAPIPVTAEGYKANYGSAVVRATPAATTTDIITLVGSATKTVMVKRVIVSGLATTAGSMDVSLVKRTVANTSGTATQPDIAKYDSSDPAPSAVVNLYTANPTVGTGIALKNQSLNFGVDGATGQALFEFSTRNDKPLVLRGIAQCLAINLNGQAVPSGGKLSASIEWEEV